jgi:hypothetical protein
LLVCQIHLRLLYSTPKSTSAILSHFLIYEMASKLLARILRASRNKITEEKTEQI